MTVNRASSVVRPVVQPSVAASGALGEAARSPLRRAAPVLAGTVIASAAFAGLLALRRDHSSQPAAPAAAPTTTAAGPGQPGALLRLERIMPAAATSASDAAAFDAMHRVDGLGWAAGDGTISIPLPDGRSIWLYGDTMLNLPGPDGSIRRNADMVRNSAVIQDGTKLTTLTTGTEQDPDDFLTPPGESDRWYWPGHGIAEEDELVVFMARTRRTNSITPGWNFASDGSDMVRLRLSDLSVREVTRMPGGANMTWGTSVISDETHTYIYGVEEGREGGERWAHVARVTAGDVHGGSFEYWDGNEWTPDASRSARLADGVSNQFTVTRTPEGRWALVTQELFLGPGLMVRTAPTPHGPWSDARRISDGPKLARDQISYNATAHPQFNADGKLLVGWNLNRSDGQLPSPDQLEDYRPKFRAIDLGRLDR